MAIPFHLRYRNLAAVRAWSLCVPVACSNTVMTAKCGQPPSVHSFTQSVGKLSYELVETQQREAIRALCIPGIRPSTVAPAALGFASLHYFVTTGNAYAAKLCLDVPDWIADFDVKDALFHSPVVAIGAALLALLLFPKLIKFSINYFALPAIIALLAWLAISHPQQSADTVYTVLEFIKEHPAASSIGIIGAAGIILGPDLLAGAAVAGVAALLAVQAGVLQLPTPQLPRLPGQQLVGQQFDKAGKLIKQKINDLDNADLAVSSRPKQQLTSNRDPPDLKQSSSLLYDASSTSSGGSSGQLQLPQPLLPVITDTAKQATTPEQQQLQHAAAGQQTEPSGQPPPTSTAASNLKSLGSGISSKLGQAGRSITDKARDILPNHLPFIPDDLGSNIASSAAAGARQVQQAGQGLQQGLDGGFKSPIGQSFSSAVKGLGGQLHGLGTRVQGLNEQISGSQSIQGLRERAGEAGAEVMGTAREVAGVLQGKLLHRKQQQPEVHGGPASGGMVTDNVSDIGSTPQPARRMTANEIEVDTILANS